jgi:hypothetical protein
MEVKFCSYCDNPSAYTFYDKYYCKLCWSAYGCDGMVLIEEFEQLLRAHNKAHND